jgi:predicted nucleotidyltransferase
MWQDAGMDRQDVITKLREHEPELRAAGVVHLSLFGSVARGDESPQSDVDLMAEFDPGREYSLLDRVRLERRLGEILGTSVDLAPARTLKDDVLEQATREAMLAF